MNITRQENETKSAIKYYQTVHERN